MKRFCILTLALSLLLGCSTPGALERRIGEKVESCKSDAPCIVRIKDLTDFQWDKMYVFSYGAYPEYIEKALGAPLPDYVEFQRRMVFLKDGKIVYREDEPTDVEHMVDGEVTFGGMNTEPSYVLFTPETAVFSAAKHKHSNGVAYSLTQGK
jgi:hypothetical protein